VRISRGFLLALAVGLLAATVALSLAIPVQRGVTEQGLLVGLVLFLFAPATAVTGVGGLFSGARIRLASRIGVVIAAYLGGVLIALVSLVSTGRLNP
jgi:hypothetical protein